MGKESKDEFASADTEDKESLDDEPKSIVLAMVKQLKYGMDLHRVTFPTFVLEPRSFLERVTDFMAHPEILAEYDINSMQLTFKVVESCGVC